MSKNVFLRSNNFRIGQVIVLIVGVLLLCGMLFSSPSRAYIPDQQNSGETLRAYFADGPYAVTSQHEYSGLVTITVSGVGQASDVQYSDAFYLYTDIYGNRIPPEHPTLLHNWVLWINGEHAENLIPGQQVPAYQGEAKYTFQINAPGGHLTFGIGDVWTADNTGSYTIQINSPSSGSIPFFSQIDPEWATHPLQTDGRCSPECGTIGACGCTLTSAAMLFAYYGANLNPPTLSDCLKTRACPFQFNEAARDCSDGQATWVSFYNDVSRYDLSRLDEEINQNGRPVILYMHRFHNNEVQTHWVLVTSGHGNNASDYLVHDPGHEQGADTILSSHARAGWVFGKVAVYDGQPGPNSVPLVMFNQNVASTQANQFDEDQFKELSATAVPSTITVTRTPIATAPPRVMSSTPVTNDVSVLSISGTISIYHLYETTLIVRLSATSTSGSVVDMQVWTDSSPAPEWEPFNTLTWVPWAPEDDRVYVRFRDEFGNVSSEFSTSIFPEHSPPPEPQVFLPVILKSQ